MSARLLTAALALGMGGVCAPASAQAPVTWEWLGNPAESGGTQIVGFRQGPTTLDLFSVAPSDIHVRRLEQTEWTDIKPRVGGGRSATVTAGGCLLTGDRSGPTQIDRTCDDGRTWTKPSRVPVECLYTRPSDGAALGCVAYPADDGGGLVVSHDDGATWTPLPRITNTSTVAYSLLEAPGPDGRPRLVAGAANGIAFSDDGGQTWTRSDLWGPFRWLVRDLEVDAATGAYYAGATDFYQNERQATVLRSDDRGATWRTLARFPTGFVFIAVGRDGALYVGTNEVATADGRIWRSVDGGATFEAANASYGNASIGDLKAGPDGRVYVASESGVWRTAEALVVADEAFPEPSQALGVSVRPNPAVGRVEVVLRLAEAQTVRVSIFDTLGREVAVPLDGAAPAGEQRLGIDTSAWPAGVYVVRASAGAQTTTARLVVAR